MVPNYIAHFNSENKIKPITCTQRLHTYAWSEQIKGNANGGRQLNTVRRQKERAKTI